MSTLFRWAERVSHSPSVGDSRLITRFILLPRKIGKEWRWLGFARIRQEFKRYRVCPPEMPAMDVVGWRDVAWETPDGFMEGGTRSNIKSYGRNGPPTFARPPSPPRGVRKVSMLDEEEFTKVAKHFARMANRRPL